MLLPIALVPLAFIAKLSAAAPTTCLHRNTEVAYPNGELAFGALAAFWRRQNISKATVAFPIDSTVSSLYLVVDSDESEANVDAGLWAPDGQSHNITILTRNRYQLIGEVRGPLKPGLWSAWFGRASPASYSASANVRTTATILSGSVTDLGSDKPRIGAATANTPIYVVAGVSDRSVRLTRVRLFDGSTEPSNLNVTYEAMERLNCAYRFAFGPMKLAADGFYGLAFSGTDSQGNAFQRTERIET